MGCTFYLGTPEVSWLRRPEAAGAPLFISARRLMRQRTWPRAGMPWALDSGGFTELNLYGKWDTPPETYAARVREWAAHIGNLVWAATQDWMCEPTVIEKTGRSIDEHQRRTVASYLRLRELAPEIPWAPAIQGWQVSDYQNCIDMYNAEGVDLAALPIVGVGTVCRRQGTAEATRIFSAIADKGIRMHGFGLKITGLRANAHLLTSADSLAWSFHARQQHREGLRTGRPFAGCGAGHRGSCANCLRFALLWRGRILAIPGVDTPPPVQQQSEKACDVPPMSSWRSLSRASPRSRSAGASPALASLCSTAPTRSSARPAKSPGVEPDAG